MVVGKKKKKTVVFTFRRRGVGRKDGTLSTIIPK